MSIEQIKYGRLVWSDELEGHIDNIGRYLGAFSEGDRPTAPQEGQEILDTDSLSFYKWNGAAWVEMSSSFIGIYDADTQPSPPEDETAIGKIIYREDIDEFRMWNGELWIVIGALEGGAGFQVMTRDTFPSAPEPHGIVYRTDDDTLWYYSHQKDDWMLMASLRGGFIGEYESFPTSGDLLTGLLQGHMVYRSDLGELYFWDGQYWVEV